MVIDFHAHIYPAKIAAKATESISNFYGDAPMRWSGSSDELIKSGSKAGVEKYIVHSTATKPSQVLSINDYIKSEMNNHSEFIGFGTIHPEFEDFENELKRIKANGLTGIKIHPDFQKFQADIPEMDNIYEVISSLKMPILFHAGDCRFDFSSPKRIRNVHEKHPKLVIVAAHFGGYTQWDEAYEYLAGQQVYFDTSSTLWKLDFNEAKKILRKHGTDKMLFGSDFPMWDHEGEIRKLDVLELTASEKEAILYTNAKNLLGL